MMMHLLLHTWADEEEKRLFWEEGWEEGREVYEKGILGPLREVERLGVECVVLRVVLGSVRRVEEGKGRTRCCAVM